MKKKATITVETERLLVVSHSRGSVEHWCEQCGTKVLMIGLTEAAAITGLTERAIFRLTEAGAIHLMETTEGKSLFCVDSILAHTGPGARQLARAQIQNRQNRKDES